MARRTFDVIDICEIFEHWYAGRSKNEVAGSLGLSRNTARKDVAAAEAAGQVPARPAVGQGAGAPLARGGVPEGTLPGAPQGRRAAHSAPTSCNRATRG